MANSSHQTLPRKHMLVAGHSHTLPLIGNLFVAEPTMHLACSQDIYWGIYGRQYQSVGHVDQNSTGRNEIWGLYGPWPRTAEYWDKLISLDKELSVLLCWRGEEPIAGFLVESQALDFVYNYDLSLAVSGIATLVPESLVRLYFHESLAELSNLLIKLAEASSRRVFVISSPPPKPEQLIRKGLRNEEAYVDLLARLGTSVDEVCLASEHLRKKLWRLYQDEVARTAREHGAVYVAAPPKTTDEHGLLLPEYSAGDVTHANYEYGTLVLNEIRGQLEGPGGE